MEQQKYIAGIKFETSFFSQSALNNPEICGQDLNEGSGRKYIYPLKQWTWKREEAVSEFAFLSSFLNNEDPPHGF